MRATWWTREVVIVVKTGHDIIWMETFLITMRARENTGLRRSQQILFFILLHGNHACLFNYFSLQEEENRLFWYQFVSSPSDSDTSHIIFISPEVELKKAKVQFCVVWAMTCLRFIMFWGLLSMHQLLRTLKSFLDAMWLASYHVWGHHWGFQ